jgi:CubicO group peptidase (beta-lactamase class C family)
MKRILSRVLVFGIAGGALLTALVLTVPELHAHVAAHLFFWPPTVSWPMGVPASAGIEAAALDQLWNELRAKRTKAFIVARGGQLIYERYGPDGGPNARMSFAAANKGLIGIPAVWICLQDKRISLDDPLVKYAVGLGPERAAIRLRDLAFHQSGIEDVDFEAGESGTLSGWKRAYWDHPAERFKNALLTAPVTFAPGTQARYSGVGYYALAYAVSRSIAGSPYRDVHELLQTRVMTPLGIPPTAWSMSYGTSYEVDGMRLFAIGSGGRFTARAAARIGEWVLGNGAWEGRRLVDRNHFDAVLGRDRAPLVSTNHGWHLNVRREYPSLPAEAVFARGVDDQVVLVVPSLELVVVRVGAVFERARGESDYASLDRHLFSPLMAAVGSSAQVTAARRVRR